MRRPTVLLADDHVAFTDGIVRVLSDHFDVVGTVADGVDLCDAVTRLHPDVVVTDIAMPTLSGLEALRRLRPKPEGLRVLMFTMHADARLAAEAFRLGARGYALKQESSSVLVKAIATVLRGQKYLASALTDEVLELVASPPEPLEGALSTRQREVLRLVVKGHRMKEVAADLNLSPRTVEKIKYDMMHALDVHSTAELVRCAIERRLVVF
jgi:two-component system response regulator NreC